MEKGDSAMEQKNSDQNVQGSNVDLQLSSVENTILVLLRSHVHHTDQIIDIPRLQDECLRDGLTATQFSHGFVRLLTRRLLEPRGDFTFSLSEEGHRLKEALVA